MDFLTKKLQRVLTLLLVFLPGLCLQAKENQTISLDLQEVTLQTAFKAIESQTPYRFSYKASTIGNDRSVTIKCKDAAIQTVMDQILKGKNLTYEIVSPTSIVILEKKAAQEAVNAKLRTVTGQVLDRAGEPVIGATVRISGTTKGTATDADGNFAIDAAKGDVLDVYCIGYDMTKVKVGDKDNVNVVMNENTEMLEDVVVIGYGTTERKRVTTAITSIKGEDMPKGVGGSTVAIALRNRINGLTMNGDNGPTSSNGIQIRGVASVNASQGPLIIVDGVPTNSLRSVDQNDIESIDVLKDASAGAIYGTRAAGGVIIVTTKKPQAGKTKVSYNLELSTERRHKDLNVLSPEEFVEEGLGPDYGFKQDWYRAALNDHPFSQKHTLTISGGNGNANVYSSLQYLKEEGPIIADKRSVYAARVNADYKALDNRLEFFTRITARQQDSDWRSSTSLVTSAARMNPTIPMMDPDDPTRWNNTKYGIDFGSTSNTNPIASSIGQRKYDYREQWLIGSGTVKVNIMKGLSVQATASLNYTTDKYYYWYDVDSAWSLNNGRRGKAYHSFANTYKTSYDAFANYKNTFGKHSIDAVAGWSFDTNSGDSFWAYNEDFTIEGVEGWNLGEGAGLTNKDKPAGGLGSHKDSRQRLMAFFGRANYSFDDKYLLNLSVRREGSSKFGPKNRWGTFWSVSGGWRLNEENFMKDLTWLNDLKIRVAYGTTGNVGIPSAIYTPTYTDRFKWPFDGVWQTTYGYYNNINENIKWEEKKEFNIGFDFSVFNNRLWGRFDYYRRRVDDLVFQVRCAVPPQLDPTMYDNIGVLENNGWEAELGGTILNAGGFKWNATLRAFHNGTRIKELSDYTQYLESGCFHIDEGSNIGQFWVFKNAGLNEEGKWMIYNKDGEKVLAEGNTIKENRIFTGNALPKVQMSLDQTLTYRNFDLGVQMHAWIDRDVYSGFNQGVGVFNYDHYNVDRDYYMKHKDIRDNISPYLDYFISDASFLKIDLVTLGYTLPMKRYTKSLIDSMRFYVTIRDLATITKFSGWDPEVNVNGLYPGYEGSGALYPLTTHYTFGFQLNF